MNRQNNTIVEVKKLSFSYDSKPVLKDVNIEMKKGEFVALIGANGAGKSTFFGLLLSRLKADSGRIRLFGDDIANKKHFEDIAYISQNSILAYRDFPTTVEELIKVHLKHLKIKRDPKLFLQEIGLETHGKNTLKQLSGGQLQRVALSIALLKDAKLILLDEPTSGIDKEFSHELFGVLRTLSNQGKTILMATHNLSDAMPYIDKVTCIQHGTCRILNEVQLEKELKRRDDANYRFI